MRPTRTWASAVTKVVFRLHKSFRNPVQEVLAIDEAGSFRTRMMTGWGTFDVEIEVHWKKARVASPSVSRLSHELSFNAPMTSRTITESVMFKSLSAVTSSVGTVKRLSQPARPGSALASKTKRLSQPACSEFLEGPSLSSAADSSRGQQPLKRKSAPAVTVQKAREKRESVQIRAAPHKAQEEKTDSAKTEAKESPASAKPVDRSVSLGESLMAAARRLDLEAVKKLLASGASANFEKRNEGGWGALDAESVLHCAIHGKDARTRPEDHFAVMETLILAKADVNAKKESRCWTGRASCQTAWDMVLDDAIEKPALLKLFLNHGANVNAKQTRSLGGMRNDGFQVRYLLNRVVKAGNYEVVKALLECGADAKVADTLQNCNERGYHSDDYETALHIASQTGRPDLAKLLLEYGAEVDAVHRQLLQESLDVSSPTDDPRDDEWECDVQCRPLHQTALHLALRGGHHELAKLLVCWGARTSLAAVKRLEWDGPRSKATDLAARLPGDERSSCAELCGGSDPLLGALAAQYSPETHHLFPRRVRSTIEAVFIVAKRQQWPMPDKVLLHVLAFAVPELTLPSTASAAVAAAEEA